MIVPSYCATEVVLKSDSPHSTKPPKGLEDMRQENRDVAWMVNQLSEEEQETAARTSYDYSKRQDAAERCYFAGEMARRYLRSKKDRTKTLHNMKDTIEFRSTMDVDGLRAAFDKQDVNNNNNNNCTRQSLHQELESKKLYVQGFDRDGRATYIFVPRRVDAHDPEWTIKGHMYTLERAIACTRSRDGTVNAVIDFSGYSHVKNAPPPLIGKQFLTVLRSHYVGRVHKIFIVGAPAAFWCLWTMFKSFIGKSTRDKIVLVSHGEKEKVLGEHYAPDQAAPWMMPESGKKRRELDVEEYLFQTPFECAFDE